MHLDEYITRRRQLAKQYDEMLKGTDLILPFEAAYGNHAYYIYVVRHPERDYVMEELKKHDIIVNISYPWPIHTMTGYAHYGLGDGSLPVTEKVAKEIFSLPMYPSLTDEQQKIVVEKLKKICNKKR
ncbi:dTDP-3-amino-3,4,6-trideoxy-alpha-D-glucose transaminase [bioreactor metagenome]|uniref:dTDP-3-amino-3,4,6-trideoxy-alpha-D-glucose transaminase n=1 Tax=bioreactor metagenome TaxID=1076179 RepID=A0A645H8N4_9ZZZZ